MKTTTILLITAFSTSLSAQGAPQGAQITGVSMGGGGCKQASASVILSPDARDLSILFDDFILEASGSNVNHNNLRAEVACTVNVSFRIPHGWQMAFVGVDYRGYANVPALSQGYQRFLFQVPGMGVVSMRDAVFTGPKDGNYIFSAQQKPGREVWTRCGLTDFRLPMTAVLGVAYQKRGHYPQAMVALDSQDMSLAQNFQVAWKRCM